MQRQASLAIGKIWGPCRLVALIDKWSGICTVIWLFLHLRVNHKSSVVRRLLEKQSTSWMWTALEVRKPCIFPSHGPLGHFTGLGSVGSCLRRQTWHGGVTLTQIHRVLLCWKQVLQKETAGTTLKNKGIEESSHWDQGWLLTEKGGVYTWTSRVLSLLLNQQKCWDSLILI
jgi:hypothetical protein